MKWNKINESREFDDSPECKEKAQEIVKTILAKAEKMRAALKKHGQKEAYEKYEDLEFLSGVYITLYATPGDNVWSGDYYRTVVRISTLGKGWGCDLTINIKDDGKFGITPYVDADAVFEALDTFELFEKDFWKNIEQLEQDELDDAKYQDSFNTESTSNAKINESNVNGILSEDEFAEKYNKRKCDMCCAKCKWFKPVPYEAGGDCTHPEIDRNDYPMSASNEICDAFEPAR